MTDIFTAFKGLFLSRENTDMFVKNIIECKDY